MLEGKELDGKIGTVGSYSLDVDSKGFVEVQVGGGVLGNDGIEGGLYLKLDIIVLLDKLAKKTTTPWDDSALQTLKSALGR